MAYTSAQRQQFNDWMSGQRGGLGFTQDQFNQYQSNPNNFISSTGWQPGAPASQAPAPAPAGSIPPPPPPPPPVQGTAASAASALTASGQTPNLTPPANPAVASLGDMNMSPGRVNVQGSTPTPDFSSIENRINKGVQGTPQGFAGSQLQPERATKQAVDPYADQYGNQDPYGRPLDPVVDSTSPPYQVKTQPSGQSGNPQQDFAASFNSTVGQPNYDPRFDMDGNGVINSADQIAFAQNGMQGVNVFNAGQPSDNPTNIGNDPSDDVVYGGGPRFEGGYNAPGGFGNNINNDNRFGDLLRDPTIGNQTGGVDVGGGGGPSTGGGAFDHAQLTQFLDNYFSSQSGIGLGSGVQDAIDTGIGANQFLQDLVNRGGVGYSGPDSIGLGAGVQDKIDAGIGANQFLQDLVNRGGVGYSGPDSIGLGAGVQDKIDAGVGYSGPSSIDLANSIESILGVRDGQTLGNTLSGLDSRLSQINPLSRSQIQDAFQNTQFGDNGQTLGTRFNDIDTGLGDLSNRFNTFDTTLTGLRRGIGEDVAGQLQGFGTNIGTEFEGITNRFDNSDERFNQILGTDPTQNRLYGSEGFGGIGGNLEDVLQARFGNAFGLSDITQSVQDTVGSRQSIGDVLAGLTGDDSAISFDQSVTKPGMFGTLQTRLNSILQDDPFKATSDLELADLTEQQGRQKDQQLEELNRLGILRGGDTAGVLGDMSEAQNRERLQLQGNQEARRDRAVEQALGLGNLQSSFNLGEGNLGLEGQVQGGRQSLDKLLGIGDLGVREKEGDNRNKLLESELGLQRERLNMERNQQDTDNILGLLKGAWDVGKYFLGGG